MDAPLAAAMAAPAQKSAVMEKSDIDESLLIVVPLKPASPCKKSGVAARGMGRKLIGVPLG